MGLFSPWLKKSLLVQNLKNKFNQRKLKEIDDFSGFSFRMKFEPTGDVIGYDLQFE